ncbi:MAG: tetratricopeptide repeat protein [candidate division WOR-3 bacterium]|nr:MAG: tetratricopeptide repeat protein [candidate division WOR-3 bacterium]
MPKSRKLFLVLGLLIAGSLLAQQQIPLDAMLRGGRIHYTGSRYERAKEQFQGALDAYRSEVDNVQLAEIHIWLGLSQAQLRENEDAARNFRAALAADSSAAERIRQDEQWQYWTWNSLINVARKSYNAGVYDTSLVSALAAIKIDPGKAGTYTLVANSYSALGMYDEMLLTARDMLALDTRSPDGLSLVGLYYLQRPDSLWTGDMKLGRWDSCAYYYNAALEVYEERYAAAVDSLDQTLELGDQARLAEIAGILVEKSREADQAELKAYIETELKAKNRLNQVAKVASQLFYSANNLNVSSSRAGSAMLRAASEPDMNAENRDRFRGMAEDLFNKALTYDPYDYTAVFNLGIVQYQSQKDSLAEQTFMRAAEGAVTRLTDLPADIRDSLLALVSEQTAGQGYTTYGGLLLAAVDSVVAETGNPSGGYSWLYFPDLRNRKPFVAPTVEDAGAMFVSPLAPGVIENTFLLLGVSQTSMGMALKNDEREEEARAKFNAALDNLDMVITINPSSADAWQNKGHCLRELGQTDKAAEAFKKYEELK